MRNKASSILLILFSTTILVACSNSKVNKTQQVDPKKEKKEEVSTQTIPGPHVIIYKTTADYNNNVPVTLSEDLSKIVSYPGIKDIFYNGELAYPTKLNNGYLLDNRGINQNVAFLNYTYEQYSKLDKVPTSDKLYANLLDKDPITEMYDCGSKYKYSDLIKEINLILDNNDLSSFKKLK